MATVGYDYDDYYDNETTCELEELPHDHWVFPILYSVFFVLGFMGNSLVIVVVSRHSSRRADIFILNLAISDLTFVLTLPFWASSLAEGYWRFGMFLCKTSVFTMAVTRCASSLLMAIISIDRYVAVIRGTRVHPFRTRNCSIRASCLIWAVSILIGFPSLLIRDLNHETLACVDSDTTYGYFSSGYRIAVIFLTFVLPLAVVVYCYCRMARFLWDYFGQQANKVFTKGRPRSRHSWLRIVTCVVGAYCMSWLPYNLLNTLVLIEQLGVDIPCLAKVSIYQGLSATAALAFANSCTNPLIYAIMDVGFRRRAQVALPRLFLSCRSRIFYTSSTMPTTSASLESSSTYTVNR